MHHINLLAPAPFLALLPDYPEDKMAEDYLFMLNRDVEAKRGEPMDADR